jgi:ATP-binding cassette subfamily F protein 3
LSAGRPQVLVLDEPTNHLDIDSREALVQAINNFAGAVILVSHDRHLIELTADRLWLVADGQVKPYDGDLDDYRRLLLGGSPPKASKEARNGSAGPAEVKPAAPQRKPADRNEVLKRRQAVRAAEKKLERLSKERASVAATLADENTYRSLGDELDTLLKRHAELEAAVEVAETRWLEAEEALEEMERR